METNTSVQIISLLLTALYVACTWLIFTKAGEKGYKSIIPFYNLYILFKVFWGKGWIWILLFIPFVNLVILVMLTLKIAKAFEKKVGFAVGLILLPFVFYPILAFSKAEYHPVPVENK